MKIHKLKLDAEFADSVLIGEKCFEVRLNDRGYQKGDCVIFDVQKNSFSMSHDLTEKQYRITYVLSGWGIATGYVVFGIKETPHD
jgi:ASC-1-like (ASCH) protein